MNVNASSSNSSVSRRRFLVRGTGAVAAFSIVPRHVLGGAGNLPPSERLNIAAIGSGGRGHANISNLKEHHQNIVALCDVDWDRAGGTFQEFPRAKKYRDFRRMLDREGDRIDAVVVSTPDHVHASASCAALRMGKHVYCEKPLAHSIHEVREMARLARENRVATQMGNGGQAADSVRLVAEMIWDDWIGPVREVHRWTNRPIWPQGIDRPEGTPPVPDTLDWNLWLGPATERPYHPAYLPFKWRGWWDFGTGALGDMGCHYFHPIFVALKLGHPTRIQADTTPVNSETYPSASTVTYEFPARGDMPPVQVTWYDGGRLPDRPEGLEEGREIKPGGGVYYSGTKGVLFNGRLVPESRMEDRGKPPQKLPRSPGHYVEWIQACKGGQPAGSNFDMASLVTSTVLLGNIAIRTGKALEWDGKRITNEPEANQFLQREYRAGWTL